MAILVTGGAGFIGSCLVRTLNDMGIEDVLIVDNIHDTEKWKNLRNKRYEDYIHKSALPEQISTLKGGISGVLHLGACSSTTEKNFDYLYQNNFVFSKMLWDFCYEMGIPFIYASSAATYGGGEAGFDDTVDIKKLQPLNGYGYSKQLFDLWVSRQTRRPPQVCGLKFFNVYGPNEYCKGSMASVLFHCFRKIKESGRIELFKSYHPDYADGEQMRDFVYVKDICKVVRFLMENPSVSGLFNVGTGRAESFLTLGRSIFKALGLPESISFIDMPESLRPKYQYFTKASMDKLRAAGYREPFFSLEEGTIDYVQNYLNRDFLIY